MLPLSVAGRVKTHASRTANIQQKTHQSQVNMSKINSSSRNFGKIPDFPAMWAQVKSDLLDITS